MTYIRQDVGGFVRRCIKRVPSIWRPDTFIMQHLFIAAYPPLPVAAVAVIWALVIVSFVGLHMHEAGYFLAKAVKADAALAASDRSTSLTWAAPAKQPLAVDVWVTSVQMAQPAIMVSVPSSGESIVLRPMASHTWRRWTPTGLDGIEYSWMGPGPTTEELERWFAQ